MAQVAIITFVKLLYLSGFFKRSATVSHSLIKIECWSLPGSGGGSVGRAVASNTRDPRFESRHRHIFIYQLYNNNTEKMKK